jgi:hypothetical protein
MTPLLDSKDTRWLRVLAGWALMSGLVLLAVLISPSGSDLRRARAARRCHSHYSFCRCSCWPPACLVSQGLAGEAGPRSRLLRERFPQCNRNKSHDYGIATNVDLSQANVQRDKAERSTPSQFRFSFFG